MLCIPHCKYQVKPQSSLSFSASCAAAIVYRNHFFPHLYQQNKSSESESSDRLVICNYSQRVLEAAKLPYTNKTRVYPLHKLGSWDFWQIANSVLNKVNLLYLFYSMAWELYEGVLFFKLEVPVFKNVGERSTAKNYYPVSLLSVVSKVIEKLVNNRIVNHLENVVFSVNRRSSDSCT